MSELTPYERDRIERIPWGWEQYQLYLRRGHTPIEAYRFTLAWARNMRQQRARRVSHGTGATR